MIVIKNYGRGVPKESGRKLALKKLVREQMFENLDEESFDMYLKDFPNESDYNIAQYGNLDVYYDDVDNTMKKAGYKVDERNLQQARWNNYKNVVGQVAREIQDDRKKGKKLPPWLM